MIIIILVFISEELMTELQKPSDAKDDSTQAPSIVCNQETFNDGICDEENNNESCGFDGGDCCEFHDLWDSRCKSQGKVSATCRSHWARNGIEFFEEKRQKPIEGIQLGQKVYEKQDSSKSQGSPFG